MSNHYLPRPKHYIDRIRDLDAKEYMVEFETQRLHFFGFGGVMNFLAYTTSTDEYVMVRANISEERYKLSENYKISCVPIDPNYASRHFYQSDLESIIGDGNARIIPAFIDYGIGT